MSHLEKRDTEWGVDRSATRRFSRRSVLQAGALLAALPIIQACGGAPAPANAPAPTAAPQTKPAESKPVAAQAAAPPKASGAPVKISHWQIGGKVFEEFFSGTIVPGFRQQQPNIDVEQTILGTWDELYPARRRTSSGVRSSGSATSPSPTTPRTRPISSTASPCSRRTRPMPA